MTSRARGPLPPPPDYPLPRADSSVAGWTAPSTTERHSPGHSGASPAGVNDDDVGWDSDEFDDVYGEIYAGKLKYFAVVGQP